jgi:hypothetical protein
MQIVTRGSFRIVLLIGDLAIKVPTPFKGWYNFVSGLLNNIKEAMVWHRVINDERRNSHLLCPVVWSSWGAWIIAMRRADKLSVDEYEAQDAISQHYKIFPGDDGPHNYGKLDGRIVKIDYGSLNKLHANRSKEISRQTSNEGIRGDTRRRALRAGIPHVQGVRHRPHSFH